MTSFAFRNSQLGSVVSASGDSFYTDISGVIFSDSSQLYSATGIAYSGNNISIFVNDSGYIQELSQDLTPQLGGDLDINANAITGIGNINISGNITSNTGNLDVVSFNINNESILTKGQISWDDTEGSLSIGLTDNSTIHIGEHRYFRIRNQTAGTLYKGQVVYATGVHSNGLISPSLYAADGTVREVRFMGVILEDVNSNNNGYVVDFGHLHDMDLDGSVSNYAVGDETWVAGDILYVHPTVAGKLTKVEPKHSISVAIVLDPGNGNGNGRMFVRPTSYGHLDDNHDVAVSGATNGQFLQYNSATDYWVPSSSGNFTTLQVNGAFTFPTGDGSANQYLKTDGNGNISWSSVAGAGSGTELSVTGSVSLTTADITGVGNINVYLDGSTIKISGSGGGGGGTLDGVGLSNYVAKWSDSDTLTTGVIYDNGTNIGIGTSSPGYKIHLEQPGSSNSVLSSFLQPSLSNGGFNQLYIGRNASNHDCSTITYSPNATAANSTLSLGLYGTSYTFNIDGNGNVGIGTVSPGSKLDVQGGRTFLAAASEPYGLGVRYINTGGAVYFGAASSSVTPDAVISNAGGLELIRFTTSGNVGIGSSSPAYRLDVVGTGHFDALNINNAFTFPTTDGSANQILKTDGNGNLTWVNQSGGGGSSLDGTILSASSSGVIVGSSGWVYQSGQLVNSQGSFGVHIGDAQYSQYLLRTTSTSASWNTLLNNGQSGILLASNRTFQFSVNIVARRTDNQDNAAYKLEGFLSNDGFGCSIIGNPIKTVFGESDSSWDVRARIADSGTSNYLFIEGYGATSKTINWLAKVDLLEVGGNINYYTESNALNTIISSSTIP